MSLRDSLKILVVDDMSTSRGLIIQALEWMGLRNIAECAEGGAAVDLLAKSPAHLVLSDYNMPGMDGLALLQKLRSTPSTARTGFILITGRADTVLMQAGQKLGMNNMIKKPFTPEQLRDCIERVVGKL